METKVKIIPSDKVLKLPKYIFTELDEWKEEARAKGADLIDLGIGNPDGATPYTIVDAAVESLKKPESHGYPCFKGKIDFRISISKWLKRRYNLDIDPNTEVQTLSGAKEGLAHIALAYTNPGDVNIVPDPYYPVLSRGTWIASGDVFHVKLEEKNGYLPDLDSIPDEVADRAKLFFLNYPNNPTGAIAPREFLEKAVKFCTKHNILLVSDLAYAEICYGGVRPLSIFEIEGAKDIAVEFHSFSKTFNMAGWRVGFVVGKEEFIKTIHALKSNIDYGTSTIVQDAAIQAISMDFSNAKHITQNYERRSKFVAERLKKLGWDVKPLKATMYFWLKVPSGHTSKEFCKMVLDKTGVVLTPGIAFGDYSDGYFRLSIVQPDEKLNEAFDRLEAANICYN